MKNKPEDNEIEYANALTALGLPGNIDPFPTSPPKDVDYWADNRTVLKKIVQAEVDSLMFSTTSFYIFVGPIGVGKTFATKYLTNPEVTEKIIKNLKKPIDVIPLSISVVTPAPFKAGEITLSIHRQIIRAMIQEIITDPILLKKLAVVHEEIGVGYVKAAFRDIAKGIIKPSGSPAIDNIEDNTGFKYLIQERGKLGKSYDVNDLVSMVKYLSAVLFSKHKRISIIIDEMENLSRTRSTTERILISDYLRRLHDVIDTSLTVILIFTFDSSQEINVVLQPALMSRIRDVIEFGYVTDHADVKEYITDCLINRSNAAVEEIMEVAALEKIANDLINTFKNSLTFRDINKQMHAIFINTYLSLGRPSKFKITKNSFEDAMKVNTDDIVKKLKGG